MEPTRPAGKHDHARSELIYHYTSAEVLTKIVDNQHLWATHLEYLNDSRELAFGLEVIERAFEYADETHKYSDPRQVKAVQFFRAELSKRESTGSAAVEPRFAACFSERGDSLSQWRAYGINGASTGVSIGFEVPAMDRNGSSYVRDNIKPVAYSSEKGLSTAAAAFEYMRRKISILDAGQTPTPEYGGHYPQTRWAPWQILDAAAYLKVDSFEDEHEWRLVVSSVPESGLKFRPSSFALTPYVEISVNASSIRTVVVGPNPHPELAKRALQQRLSKSPMLEVHSSEIPFRSW